VPTIRDLLPIVTAALLAASAPAGAAEVLFESEAVTGSNVFTRHIEGPSTDADGNVYVCNFRTDGTVGRLRPGQSDPKSFLSLPRGSIPNGSRFDKNGRMFLADFKGHAIFVVERGARSAAVYFRSTQFHQPNDLAISSNGALFASDPDFGGRNGRIWRVVKGADGRVSGAIMASDRTMGVANGLDLSPDEKTLYVSESDTREVWSYAIEGDKLTSSRLIHRFEGPAVEELDGLRTDVNGRIFVARPGAGTIAVLGQDGSLVREVKVLGPNPSNLTFGGPDGKTIYVTNASTRGVEVFRTDGPGREFCWRSGASCPPGNQP
jgi:sugar lactone lactonase YvrE